MDGWTAGWIYLMIVGKWTDELANGWIHVIIMDRRIYQIIVEGMDGFIKSL